MYRAKIFHCFPLFFNYFHCFFHWHSWTIFNVLFTRDKHFFNVFSHATNVFFTRGSHKSLRARGGLLGCVSIALAENITAPALGSEKIIFGRRFFPFCVFPVPASARDIQSLTELAGKKRDGTQLDRTCDRTCNTTCVKTEGIQHNLWFLKGKFIEPITFP